MTCQVELFYDFRSPYSYLAFTQLLEMDVAIILRPMQIRKLMEKVGNVPTTLTCAAKGQYARLDIARWAKRYGVDFNPGDMRETDSDACSRAVLAACSPSEASAITLALYRACWSKGRTLASSADVLAAIAGAQIDTAHAAARMDSREVAAELEANTEEAAERGVFGSPSMFVGETLFFGNDRLDFVREELARVEEPS